MIAGLFLPINELTQGIDLIVVSSIWK